MADDISATGDRAPRSASEAAQMSEMRSQVEWLVKEAGQRGLQARNWARFWGATHILLGFPAAVLAAISGASGLASADLRVRAALLALLAAGFSAGEGFLRSDSRAAGNRRRKRAWRALESDARLVLAREAHTDPATLYDALRRLLEQRKIAMAGGWGVPDGPASSQQEGA